MINKSIIAFLKTLKPDEIKEYFLKTPDSTTVGKVIPSPRAWENVSNILQLNLPDEQLYEMIKGVIGEEATSRFSQVRNACIGNITLETIRDYYIQAKTELLDLISSETLKQLISSIVIYINTTSNKNLLKDQILSDAIVWFINYIIKYRSAVFKTLCKIDADKLKIICTAYKNHSGIDVYNNILDKYIDVNKI